MRSKYVVVGIGTTVGLLASMPACVTALAAPMPAAPSAGVVTADYQMNEPVGSTVMTDDDVPVSLGLVTYTGPSRCPRTPRSCSIEVRISRSVARCGSRQGV